jgi:hypothetical protein
MERFGRISLLTNLLVSLVLLLSIGLTVYSLNSIRGIGSEARG